MHPDVKSKVREELERESSAGFPKLRKIPNSAMVKFLDYFESLSGVERAALLDARAEVAALAFSPPPQIAQAFEALRTGNRALLQFGQAMNSPRFVHGFRYDNLRMAKAILNDDESMTHLRRIRAALDFEPRDDPPKELIRQGDIQAVTTAKAPLLRKMLNAVLPARLGAKAVKRPGGELVYDGALDGVPMTVSIIFSNLYAQMAYAATIKIPERSIFAFRLTYESLWGSGTGWDYLTEENAARSIDLLAELLATLGGFVRT